jgi:hypothetical protein
MAPAEQQALQSPIRARYLLLAIWLLWSVALLALNLPSGNDLINDPDDFMRLVQVRDWMAGQSWFDVTQYRINPPDGGLMHWSRILDLPIAGMIWLGQLFLPREGAEYATLLFLPLLYLGLLMALLFRTARQLATEKVALAAVALLPTFPLVVRQFLPGRIDHHSWQILMAALAMYALFDRNQKRGAYLMAFALAFWMHVSIEGLPYVGMFGAIMGAFYLFPANSGDQNTERRLIDFSNGLAAFSIGLWGTTQASANLSVAYCDAVSWPLIATLLFVCAGLNLVHYGLRPRTLLTRAISICVIGAAGAALFVTLSNSCALDPFGQLTPLVQEFWHETIAEGLPIHDQAASVISLLLFVPLLAGVWTILILRNADDSAVRKQWLTLFALVLMATLLSFVVQRTAGAAELFSIIAIAALLLWTLQRIGQLQNPLIRVFGAAFAVVMMLPMTAFVVGDALFAAPTQPEVSKTAMTKHRACDFADLNSLPTGRIFTTMAPGPEILYRTKHSVYVSGYHRNAAAMDRLIATMLGPTENAQAVLRDAKIDYVVFCPSHFEAESYLKARKTSFAQTLAAKTPQIWLHPVPEFADGEMRVYRFLPQHPGQ